MATPTLPTTTTTPLIATVESYLCPSLPITSSPSTDPTSSALHVLPLPTLSKLRNLGPARVKDMRLLGHARQIVSHIPIAASPQTCAKFNDAVYAAMCLNAEKFAALALLPGGDGQGREAAGELARCVGKYRFVGGVVGVKRGRDGEGTLSDASFEELWSAAEKFRVPILLRELWPAGSELADYQRTLPATVLAPLLTHIHTAHLSSPIPLLHLYLTNVFDRHPNLRLILAHPGALPSLLPRIESLVSSIPVADKPNRDFLDVWQHNIYITTADVHEMSSMRALLEQIPLDRVLFASNYPLGDGGKEVMEELRESGFLTGDEWDMLACGNAEAVFNLKGSGGKSGARTGYA